MRDIEKIKKVKELTNMLNTYRNSYYNNSESLISDKQYDELFDELQTLEEETGIVMSNSPTKTVGYEVKSKLEKTKHSHPMLSLAKTKSTEELKEFVGENTCMLSCKLDGLTVLLTYENGELIKAETRGNGEEGELITHTAKVFENIPLHIDYKERLEVEGEAIITYDDFEKINSILPENERYKNPRNLVSGSVRQLDSNIASKRHIKFVAWKVPYGLESRTNTAIQHKLNALMSYNFDIVPYELCSNYTIKNLETYIDRLRQVAKEEGYPIDGIVCTYANIEYGESLGMTGHHPKHSLAFKFYDEEVTTTIKYIEWTMGKTGVLTPVAVFEAVEIEGTQVEKASLSNLSILKKTLGEHPFIGQEISVTKRNCIIPKIERAKDEGGEWI